MRSPTSPTARDGRRRGRTVALALALSLVLLPLAGGCTASQPGSAPQRAAAGAMSSPLALSPHGAVAWPFAFEWQAAPGAGVYRVSVLDEAERLLLERETRDTRLAAPPELRSMLRADQPFYWRVGILDVNGNLTRQSALTEFRLKAGR